MAIVILAGDSLLDHEVAIIIIRNKAISSLNISHFVAGKNLSGRVNAVYAISQQSHSTVALPS